MGGDNIREVVPFLRVSDMERSLRYYVDGLGFVMKNNWIVEAKIRWCRLARGGADLMLQEIGEEPLRAVPSSSGRLGIGVSLNFQCEDAIALHHELASRGIAASEPRVENALWEMFVIDPDGYRLDFASPTDVPEETKLSELIS